MPRPQPDPESHASAARPRRRRRVAAFTAALVALGGVAIAAYQKSKSPRASGGDADARRDEWVQAQLQKMTLEQKVGQMIMTLVYGDSVDTDASEAVAANRDMHGLDNAEQLLEKYHLGGVIYFGWANDLHDPRKLAELSNGLQAAAARAGAPPLLVSTDQEHGVVRRLGSEATLFPGNMALGAARDCEAAFAAARVAGVELRAMGVNENFAPVADVNVNPANPVIGVRSFSSDPKLVAELAAAQVRGYQEHPDSTTSAAKHFPGHGNTDQDSHDELPAIPHTLDQWREIDAPPFTAAVAAGIDSVMTAHIQFPALDDSMDPATLSKPIVTGVLREELGFDGVVVTDSLRMKGVRELYSDAQIPVRAVQAGVDLLLMPPDTAQAHGALLRAVADGELTEARLDESVRRILRLKYQRGVVKSPYVDVEAVKQVVGSAEHRAVAQEVADKSITVLKNAGDLLPLSDSGKILVAGCGESTTAQLAGDLRAHGLDAVALPTGESPDAETVAAAVAAAESSDVVVLITNNAWADPGQIALAAALSQTSRPMVAAAVNQPYDAAHLQSVEAFVAAYSDHAPTVTALAAVLAGRQAPQGRLPVTIPHVDDPDATLYEFGRGLNYDD